MTMAATATICPCRCSQHDPCCRRCRRCRCRHRPPLLPPLPLPPQTAAVFWLIVVAPQLPLFLPPLPAPLLPLLSADAITTFAAAEITSHIPSTAAATVVACFTAVTTSSLIPLNTANVFAAQTLPLFPSLLHHCLCLRPLCRQRFRNSRHHCRNFPTCRSVGASKGW